MAPHGWWHAQVRTSSPLEMDAWVDWHLAVVDQAVAQELGARLAARCTIGDLPLIVFLVRQALHDCRIRGTGAPPAPAAASVLALEIRNLVEARDGAATDLPDPEHLKAVAIQVLEVLRERERSDDVALGSLYQAEVLIKRGTYGPLAWG